MECVTNGVSTDLNGAEWVYRGAGNRNIVFANVKVSIVTAPPVKIPVVVGEGSIWEIFTDD
jgi:hypothetical protein